MEETQKSGHTSQWLSLASGVGLRKALPFFFTFFCSTVSKLHYFGNWGNSFKTRETNRKICFILSAGESCLRVPKHPRACSWDLWSRQQTLSVWLGCVGLILFSFAGTWVRSPPRCTKHWGRALRKDGISARNRPSLFPGKGGEATCLACLLTRRSCGL